MFLLKQMSLQWYYTCKSYKVGERNQAMQHTKAEACAKKGEIQKFHLHNSSSNEEFQSQDPIYN